MSIEEALQSTDVSVIKQGRKVAKGKVTRNVNSLDLALVVGADGHFLFNEINDKRLEEVYEALRSSYDKFQELHERYIEYASPETDEQMSIFIQEEGVYANDVANSVSKIDRKYAKFQKSSDAIKSKVETENKLSCLKKEVARHRTSLEGKAGAASLVIKATDLNIKKTAKFVKTELNTALDSYKSKVSEYDEALVSIDKDLEAKFTEEKDYATILQTVEDLVVKLEAIALELPPPKSTSTSPPSGTDRISNEVVKLQKISCPKFSGIPREFAQFKRDFNKIVAVPGRSDVEIGYNLRDSIPQKHCHLLDHLDTTQHKEMMELLEAKFGNKSLVVRDIISQIEKTKSISSDKAFIEFVEQLEKIKLDLETLDQISEVANAGYIGKIESRLPFCISTDWWKIVEDEDLDTKLSLERFDRLMLFLTKSKKRVENQTSSLNQISGGGNQGKSITQFNVVTGAVSLVAKQAADSSKKKKKERVWNPCLACNVDGCTDLATITHPMDSCSVWNGLSQREKESRAKCLKHPFKTDHSTADCTVSGKRCKICSKDGHHFLLCPSRKKGNANVAKVTSSNTAKGDRTKNPVMLQAQFVSGPNGSRLGALLDLASTDHYVTNKYARKHNLHGDNILLTVGGIAGIESTIETKVYDVPLMVNGQIYEIQCYGLDVIASVAAPPERSLMLKCVLDLESSQSKLSGLSRSIYSFQWKTMSFTLNLSKQLGR